MGVCTLHHDSAVVQNKEAHIYGIARFLWSTGQTSPQWIRTDDSQDFTATASVDTTAGSSDFDNCYPWCDMRRVTFTTGDTMVHIPKFYYQRTQENGMERIRISDVPVEGFELHPGSGKYVGAYQTSSNNKSVSGATPQGSQSRETMRANAAAKGTGWSLWTAQILSAIEMLYLVEFANNYSQSVIGQGNQGTNITTGCCNNVANRTGKATTSPVGVVYRGIENLWGSQWSFIDGIICHNLAYYICDDITKFAGTVDTANYYALSYKNVAGSGWYIADMGYDEDHPWAMFPSKSGAAGTTGYTDGCWVSNSANMIMTVGGSSEAVADGLFCSACNYADTGTRSDFGSRLACDHMD